MLLLRVSTMKNVLITGATLVGLGLAYFSAGEFVLHQDPWPLLYVLSIVLIASVGGLLHRESQILIGSLGGEGERACGPIAACPSSWSDAQFCPRMDGTGHRPQHSPWFGSECQ